MYHYLWAGDMKLGDDSSGEQPLQILDSAFDFLDDQDSTCDFFGVKRHSMTMDEQQDLMSKGEQRYESSDEEVSFSNISLYSPMIPEDPPVNLGWCLDSVTSA